MVRMPSEALPHALFALLVARVTALPRLPVSVTPPLANLALPALCPPLDQLTALHALKAHSPTLLLQLATLVLLVTKVSMATLFVARVLLLALDVLRASTVPRAVPIAPHVLLVSRVPMASISILVPLMPLAQPAQMALTAVPAMLPALCALLDQKEPEFPLLNEPTSMLLAIFVPAEPAALLVMLTAPVVLRDFTLLETLPLALVAPLVKKARMARLLVTPLRMVATHVPLATILLILVKLIATLALRVTTAVVVLRFALIVELANKVSITRMLMIE